MVHLKTFVSTLVQKSRIPSNWDQHFGITCLAYNTCQLLQFTVEVYSKYFESRILNVVLNRRRCVSFEPPPLGNHTWLKLQTMSLQFKASPVLTSFIASTQNVVSCSCHSRATGNTWKHLKSVLIHNHIQSDLLYQGSPEERRYAIFAVGLEKLHP